MHIINRKILFLLGSFALISCTSACDAFPTSTSTTKDAERDALVAKRNDMKQVEKSDPVMNAAIADAKKTLPAFIAKLDSSNDALADATFKYPLAGWEHIWVGDVKHDGEFLTGTLANEPAEPGHKMGESVRVSLKDVSDWAYRDEKGVMQGHYTTRVLLPQLDAEEATGIKESFGW